MELRFIERTIENGDGTGYTAKILQHRMKQLNFDGTITEIPWQDVPLAKEQP